MTQAGSTSRYQLNELEELRNEAYENTRIYKAKTKVFHDKHINQKIFESNQKVWFFNANLRLFPGELHSRWDGSFIVTQVFPHGAIKIKKSSNGNTFKVNWQRLKHFVENIMDGQMIKTTEI